MPEAVTFTEIKTAVAEALEADPATEEPILRRLLGNDEHALAEARRWVAASREASDLFERPITADNPALLPFQSAGPYSVVRRLGSGGMGVVYEVEHEGRHFALKSIRPSMVSDWSLARFRQETGILGRLDHPSIARLVDTGTVNDLPFFVMELVEGEPIDSYVEQTGLSIEDRLRLFVAVCRSVGYAHDQGFVHRDLKPNNIWVTRDGLPKLLDFGIAKAVAGNTTLANNDQTQTANRMITPAYASPEHLRGEVTGPATDVYSLGVILFEVASGRRYPAAAAEATVPGAGAGNKRLDWIIRKALEPDPKKRYGSASALADDIERMLAGEKIQARGEPLGKRIARRMRHRPAIVGVVIVAALAAATWSGWSRFIGRPTAKMRPSVAIAGLFTGPGRGTDAQWVPDALNDALELELGATGKLRVIRGADVDRIRASFQKELSRGDIPQGLAAQVPADYYVTGQLKQSGEGPVRVLLQFMRRATNEVVYTETAALSRNQVPMTAYAASRGFQRTLGVLTEDDVRGTQPIPYLGNPQVAELYARALDANRGYRYQEAHQAVDAAVKIDPDNPVVRLARAKILTNIGARIEARQESERALKLAAKLPREQQLAIEALDHQLHGRWNKAEDVLRHLSEIFYDDPRYAADLAHDIGIQGRHKEALDLIERFRNTMPVDAVPFWFYLVAIEEATESSDFARAGDYIALVKKRVGPASLEMAQVLRLEARSRKAQQKPLEALAIYEQAAPVAERGGDLYTLSSCWNEMGIIHYDLNHTQQAEEYYQRALILSRKTGTRLVEGNLLNNLGLIVQQRGDLARAEQMFREGLSAYTEVGSNGGFTLINLGNTQLLRGDYARAKATLDKSMEMARKLGDPQRIGWTLLYEGHLAYETYDDRRAVKLMEEGWNVVKDQGPAAAALAGRLGRELAAARRRSGDISGAQAALDEAIALLEKQNAPNVLAWTLISRVPILLELGDLDAAANDASRIGKLSAPGVDPIVDFEAAVLKGATALERHYDPQAVADLLARAAKLKDKDDRCWSGDRVYRVALRSGDFGAAQQASSLCRSYLAGTRSSREHALYRTREAVAEWAATGKSAPPPEVKAAIVQARQRGAIGDAVEFEALIRDVSSTRLAHP